MKEEHDRKLSIRVEPKEDRETGGSRDIGSSSSGVLGLNTVDTSASTGTGTGIGTGTGTGSKGRATISLPNPRRKTRRRSSFLDDIDSKGDMEEGDVEEDGEHSAP